MRLLLFLLLACNVAFAQLAPKPYGPIPSKRQLAWHDIEIYGLIHLTPTTFENKEWGFGDAEPTKFNPTEFNANQIIETAKAGGLKGIILVAKHHDGFALWPTKTTDYNITKSPFRAGKGDLVKEVETAVRKNNLKFGLYCSPWDRNNAKYGTNEYLPIYQAQLRELYSNYGELFMSWFDGANGGDGYYGGAREKRAIDNSVYYDWKNTWNITRTMQPMANIFSDIGPDIRWVGNEEGFAASTSWATFTPSNPSGANEAVPGQANYPESPKGTRNGKYWIPAECDVPLRKGWFYHENEKPKSAEQLFDLYLKSVGRGAGLDLGLAPDTRGLLHADDVKELTEFGRILKNTFAKNLIANAQITASNSRGINFNINNVKNTNNTYWATTDAVKTATINVNNPTDINFDIISLQEYIALGQRIDSYQVEVFENNTWKKIAEGESIGHKKLIKLDNTVKAKKIRITLKAPVCITLKSIGFYKKVV
jgi:alpha-L-fucosidase